MQMLRIALLLSLIMGGECSAYVVWKGGKKTATAFVVKNKKTEMHSVKVPTFEEAFSYYAGDYTTEEESDAHKYSDMRTEIVPHIHESAFNAPTFEEVMNAIMEVEGEGESSVEGDAEDNHLSIEEVNNATMEEGREGESSVEDDVKDTQQSFFNSNSAGNIPLFHPLNMESYVRDSDHKSTSAPPTFEEFIMTVDTEFMMKQGDP